MPVAKPKKSELVYKIVNDIQFLTGRESLDDFAAQSRLRSARKRISELESLDLASFYHAQAMLDGILGIKDECLANHKKALELEPDNLTLYKNAATSFNHLNLFDEAEQVCDNMINVLPDNPDSYSNAHSFYERYGKLKKIADHIPAVERFNIQHLTDDYRYYKPFANFIESNGISEDQISGLFKAVATVLDSKPKLSPKFLIAQRSDEYSEWISYLITVETTFDELLALENEFEELIMQQELSPELLGSVVVRFEIGEGTDGD